VTSYFSDHWVSEFWQSSHIEKGTLGEKSRYTVSVRFPAWAGDLSPFRCIQTLWGPPSLLFSGCRSPRVNRPRQDTDDSHPVSRLIMTGAVFPLSPTSLPSCRVQGQLHLFQSLAITLSDLHVPSRTLSPEDKNRSSSPKPCVVCWILGYGQVMQRSQSSWRLTEALKFKHTSVMEWVRIEYHLASTKTNYASLVFSRNTCLVCMNHRAGHAVFRC